MEAEIPFPRLQDPYGIAFWPEFKGRDGCRTPMPWTAQDKFGGFSTVEPWLPFAEEHREHAVDLQESNRSSVLNFCRTFLAWRRQHPALTSGRIRFIDAPEDVLAFIREHPHEQIVAAFNLAGDPASWSHSMSVASLEGHGFSGTLVSREIKLPPYAAFFGSVKA